MQSTTYSELMMDLYRTNKSLRFLSLLFLLLVTKECRAQLLKSRDAVLAEAYAHSDTVLRKTVFLSDAQVRRIQNEARSTVDSKIITFYQAMKADSAVGYAYFETITIRTKPGTFVVLVNPDGTVREVEMLAFYEPWDYLPTANWFYLFIGKILNPELWPGRAIDHVTGATLTVRAVTAGVRRILATHATAVVGRD